MEGGIASDASGNGRSGGTLETIFHCIGSGTPCVCRSSGGASGSPEAQLVGLTAPPGGQPTSHACRGTKRTAAAVDASAPSSVSPNGAGASRAWRGVSIPTRSRPPNVTNSSSEAGVARGAIGGLRSAGPVWMASWIGVLVGGNPGEVGASAPPTIRTAIITCRACGRVLGLCRRTDDASHVVGSSSAEEFAFVSVAPPVAIRP
jgi:hypothetical protein